MLEWLNKKLEEDINENSTSQEARRKELTTKLSNLNIKQSCLVDSYLEQDIDRQTFLLKKEEIVKEKQTVKEKLVAQESGQNNWLEPMKKWLESLSSICKIINNDNSNQKKQLVLDLFGSNLILSNKKLHLAMAETTEGTGENRLATPAPQAYFRLYSELRSVIKNRPTGELDKNCRNMWAREDSNLHELPHQLLRLACIPISPLAHTKKFLNNYFCCMIFGKQ